ncbi:Syntaxin-binding protein 6 [Microtus ochrogaster]|uniref:Syntaxin-binding protein 6 n=1 Tax=Microtus ochrogaster TaxID=79684 RepID=A0A8J6KYN0_MICOH|nr:Syntaxin-binding protein 6 [Microtus ochrogaster]
MLVCRMIFINGRKSSCVSMVTNKKPTQASITKVKQFEGSTSFVRRSQWMLEQLRQVNGIDPNRDSAEFDLLFENAFDQWVASTASEKCTFFQILHHTCQRYLTDRKPEFINCQSKIMGGNSILHSAADSVTSAVQKASQALNERGERLGRAEEKTEDMKNSAQQFAETAHKAYHEDAISLAKRQPGLLLLGRGFRGGARPSTLPRPETRVAC